jgi:hypothetical protein
MLLPELAAFVPAPVPAADTPAQGAAKRAADNVQSSTFLAMFAFIVIPPRLIYLRHGLTAALSPYPEIISIQHFDSYY